jgi:ABC-type glucose/galactose transport system permease subunit
VKIHTKINQLYKQHLLFYKNLGMTPWPTFDDYKSTYLFTYKKVGPLSLSEMNLYFDWEKNEFTEKGLLYLAERKI